MDYGFERVTDMILSELLDRLYPNTGSKELVEHVGKVYRRRFVPLVKQGNKARPCGKLGGGKVTKWSSYWELRIELNEHSSVHARLESRFPKARSGEIVILDGMRYRARYAPKFSRSYKTIHSWERWWECLGPVDANVPPADEDTQDESGAA